jgi:hypothetical protein
MQITLRIRQAAFAAAKKICSDFGMTADKSEDAIPGTDIDRNAAVEVSSAIIEELRKIKP